MLLGGWGYSGRYLKAAKDESFQGQKWQWETDGKMWWVGVLAATVAMG